MIALFDSGNSHLHFAVWDNGRVIEPINIPYPSSANELPELIKIVLGGRNPEKVAACSVSSRWRELLFYALNEIAPGKLVVARAAYDIGMNVIYDNPEQLGVDRVLAAYAAYRLFKDSCVVIDAGTAVTIDAVTEDGTFAGGFIFPGPDVLSWSLTAKTDLPYVSAAVECEGIGKSTESCISKALHIGLGGAVTELVNNAIAFVGGTDRLVVTGGGAEILKFCLPFKMLHRPFLVIEGLGYSVDSLPEFVTIL
ncbi:type III pantothenate kinase [Candidatus Latescibacterota bacterium]